MIDPTKTPPHRKTCRRENVADDAHSLTFSCFKRQPFLSRDRTCQWLVEAIEYARVKHEFDVWAYVIMPEHAHLLICPRGEYSISAILTSIKQPVSKRARLFVERNAPAFAVRMRDEQPNGRKVLRFWQRGGGYDRNLRSPKYIWETVDYIHANPIRRGLCAVADEWRWSSAADYLGVRSGPLVLGTASLPSDPRA